MSDDDRVNRPQEQQQPRRQDEQRQKRRDDPETGREPPRGPRVTDPDRDEPEVTDDEDSRA